MMNAALKLWSKHAGLVLGVLGVLIIASIFHTTIREDEAWVGEYSYQLYKSGRVHSTLLKGFYDHEKLIAVHHYLFLRITAALLYLLPWDILTLRIIPFVAGALVTALIVLFLRKEYKWPLGWALLAGSVFVLFPINYEYFAYYRPEFVVAFFGFGSFWALYRFRKSDWYFVLAGALAGVAMLVHLNALIYAFAGGGILLWYRQWKGFVLFSAAAVIAFLPYMVFVLEHLDLFFYQLSSGANSGGKASGYLAPLINLLNEQKRWFRGPHTIVVSVLCIASVWFLLRDKTRKVDQFLLIYTALLLLVLGVFAVSKTSQYSILFYPQFAVIIAAALIQFVPSGATIGKPLRVFFTIAWLAFAVFSVGWLFYPFVTPQPDIENINQQLARKIPANSRCLGPMNFVFNQIDNYEVMALLAFHELQEYDTNITDLVRYCHDRDIEYLLLDPTWKERIQGLQEKPELVNQNFTKMAEVEGTTLYKFNNVE